MIHTKVDLRSVENSLRRIQLAGKDLRPLFRRVRKAIRADQREHQKEERGPDGKWPSLDADTLKKRTRQGKGRRHKGRKKRKRRVFPKMLGRLPRSFVIKFNRNAIRGESRAKWSGAHQHPGGGSVTVGRGARIKDRTFLWASTGLLQHVARETIDFLKAAWEKGAK